MSHPGRNDPCRCGSGRKFKRYCGNVVAETPITHADRDQALEVLTKFIRGRRFEEDLALATVLFWGEDLAEEGALDLDEDELWLAGLFIEWCAFDYVTSSGRTIAEHALEERGGHLSPGARRFIERCAAFPIRLTQVEHVDRGHGVTLKDLLERRRTYAVRDRLGSERMVRHDVVAARLAPDAGEWIIEGTTARLLPFDKEALVRDVKRTRRRLSEEPPEASLAEERMVLSRTIRLCRRPRALRRVAALDDDDRRAHRSDMCRLRRD